MANNKIQVKRTNVSGRTANVTNAGNAQYIDAGEFALNMADGILYSSNGSALIEVGANNTNQRVTGTLTVNAISANGGVGTSGQVLKSNGTSTYWATDNADVGAAGQILYRNASNVLTTSTGLQYDGVSIKVNGNLESTYQNGDEGGEIFLNKPAAANTSIAGTGVTIDIFQNKLRIFENGGGNRGAYIDITAATAGVGSNLLGGGGGGSVNVDAQYVWTNTQTFTSNITFGNNISVNDTKALFLNGMSDTNWKIGRNTGGFTKFFYTGNTVDVVAANSATEGIAFGQPGANTYLETGYNGTYTRLPIYIGNSTQNVVTTNLSMLLQTNTTVNSTHTASLLQIANSTATSNLTATSLNIFSNSTVNGSLTSTTVSVANSTGNVQAVPTSVTVQNSTVNAVMGLQSVIIQSNTTVNGSITNALVQVANSTGNVQVTATTVKAQTNTTVNSTISSSLVQVSNSTSTANLSAIDLKIGTTTVNSSALALSTTFIANSTSVHTNNVTSLNATSDLTLKTGNTSNPNVVISSAFGSLIVGTNNFNGTAFVGYSNNQSAIAGYSNSGVGFYGQSTSSSGLQGLSTTGSGVYGQSNTGIGGQFQSNTGTIAQFANNTTTIGVVNALGAFITGTVNATALSTGTTFVANSTQVTVALPVSANGDTGTAGHVLTSGGTGANAYWAAAAGGGYYKGGTAAVGTLAIGGQNLFRVNANTLNNNTTFVAGENAQATGPIAVASGITLTVESGARVSIV